MPYKVLKPKTNGPEEHKNYVIQYLGTVEMKKPSTILQFQDKALDTITAIDADGKLSTMTIDPEHVCFKLHNGTDISVGIRNVSCMGRRGRSSKCLCVLRHKGKLIGIVFDCHFATDLLEHSKRTFAEAMTRLNANQPTGFRQN